MKTILKALREKGKVVKEDATTIARALGGSTISSAVSSMESTSSNTGAGANTGAGNTNGAGGNGNV